MLYLGPTKILSSQRHELTAQGVVQHTNVQSQNVIPLSYPGAPYPKCFTNVKD